MSIKNESPKSPCQKVCQIDLQLGYCRGCLRTLEEIAAWPTLSDEQKIRVLAESEKRRKKE